MIKLKVYSERYVASGNIGENARSLLGAPTINRLHALIRESIQNISDAAKHGEGPKILLRYRKLTTAQRHTLKENIFSSELPFEANHSRDLIDGFLQKTDARVLEICDFNTTGLGGPTRADEIPEDEEDTDFIDFMRNVGSPRDTPQGGGTYGFGKVSLYEMSQCGTIIVDSQVKDKGEIGRRLIGCHIGKSFKTKNSETRMLTNHTGRHWWGITKNDDPFTDPLEGNEAAELAHKIGMPQRGESDSGTSIMILDINKSEIGDQPGRSIEEAVLWNFWPRLTEDADKKKKFELKIEIDGEEHICQKPEKVAPFDLFARALTAARQRKANDRSETSEEVKAVKSYKFKRLGQLATVTDYASEDRFESTVDEDDGRLIPSRLSHIALMRPAELVVKYVIGAPVADDSKEWCGVFLADEDDEVERAFAKAEPPAHDDWVPANLPNGTPEKSYVSSAMKAIKKVAGQHSKTFIYMLEDGVEDPRLKKVSKKLGKFLAGATFITPPGPSPDKQKRKKKIKKKIRGGEIEISLIELKAKSRLVSNDGPDRVAVYGIKVNENLQVGVDRYLHISPILVRDDGSAYKSDDKNLSSEISKLDLNGNEIQISKKIKLPDDPSVLKCELVIPGLCAVSLDANIEYKEHG